MAVSLEVSDAACGGCTTPSHVRDVGGAAGGGRGELPAEEQRGAFLLPVSTVAAPSSAP